MKSKVEMSTEKIGAVFTKTVAFRIVVSITADTKRMKWSPIRTPKREIHLMFAFTIPKLKDCFKTGVIAIKVAEAIMRRQKAMEETLRPLRSLMKIAAVPNSIPAMEPSVKDFLLLLSGR